MPVIRRVFLCLAWGQIYLGESVMKKLAACLALLLCTSVQASERKPVNINANLNVNKNINANLNANKNTNVNKNTAVGLGIAKQRQKQAQLQAQKQAQLQGQHQNANNSGNHQTIKFEDERQAPAIGGPASGPCTGFGGSLSVIGGAMNFATVDDECSKREAARVAHMLGEAETARKVLMSLDAVKAVMEQPAVGGGAEDGLPLMSEAEQNWFDNL